ncbi:hypothetical protein CKO38_18515, partial [Rhodospirillum rubrum]|uniref:hypothetical protein n=1 Tax=Rhodospirillum rubrum TaxID=1085 RepID=UPI001A920B9F
PNRMPAMAPPLRRTALPHKAAGGRASPSRAICPAGIRSPWAAPGNNRPPATILSAGLGRGFFN